MKKILSLICLAVLTIACSKDDAPSTYGEEAIDVVTTTNTILDFEAVNPITEVPKKSFDNTSSGMYHGIVVTQDVSVHGKIWVNVANNGEYNATVVTDKGDHMAFYGTPISRSQDVIAFEGKNGTFTFDASDFNAPIATNVSINGIDGYVQTVKDRSDQRASATLGTYEDFNDASFTGSWDLITDGTPDPFYGLPLLTQTCVIGPGGAMFVDTVMESFDWSCFTGGTLETIQPIFARFEDPNNYLGGNEFWAQDQTLPIGGTNAFYALGQSTIVSNDNGGIPVGLFNFDLSGGGDPATCQAFAIQGVWVWNGRSGSIDFIDDAIPTRANTQIELLEQFDFSNFELNTAEINEINFPNKK